MPTTPDYMTYPLNGTPEHGETLSIKPGIRWLRMPLPFLLGHINLWLLDDGDAVTIVDTGLDNEQTRTHWQTLLDEKTVSNVIVTHMHPDHIGSAGWLCEQYDTRLKMSQAEYLMCRVLVSDTGRPAPQEGIDYYRGAGFGEDAIKQYAKKFGGFGKLVAPLPNAYERLQHDQRLTIGDHEWRVIGTSGHCPEHASLYCEQLNLYIAGDQLLPTISSNVSVWPTEPEGDPLGAWLYACQHLIDTLDKDVLVLPSHGKPFTGAHDRLQALIDEHQAGLTKLLALCQQPKRAVDTFRALFKSHINDSNLIMATGEAIAHLNYLHQRGKLTRYKDDDGIYWYQTAA